MPKILREYVQGEEGSECLNDTRFERAQIWEFENVMDYLDNAGAYLCEGGQPWSDQREGSRESITGDKHFTGTRSMEEALKLVRYGWEEGLERINKFKTALENALTGLIPILETHFDVVGDWLDVGRFVTGEPEVFGELVDSGLRREATTPRIINVVANIAASASIDTETIMTRGAAMCALVDLLEKRNYRVQIDLVHAVEGHRTDKRWLWESRTRVKEAGEMLQLDKLAFLMAHPSSLRRLGFAMQEHSNDEWRTVMGVSDKGYGYGMPCETFNQGDLYMPQILSSRDWDTDVAIAWIKAMLKKQGITSEYEGI